MIQEREGLRMSGLTLFFEKFKSKIRTCVHIDLDYDFASIVEQLMQVDNGIKYKYEQGILKLVTNYFEIRTDDLENIIYEIDLSCLRKNEICIEIDDIEVDFDLICGKYEKMENLLRRNEKIDLKKFVEFYKKTVGVSEDNMIFKRVREIRYPNRTLSIKMYLENDILKIEKRCFPIKKDIDNKVCVTDNRESKSMLESIVINNQITINVHKKELLHTIRELEKLDIEYDIGVAIMHIVGHCIEVECFEINSSDFSLVFCGKSLLHAYLYNDILENSYFITTKGVKHNIGEIWKKEVKNSDSIYVEGYGADDAWHHAGKSKEKGRYYVIGYNL